MFGQIKGKLKQILSDDFIKRVLTGKAGLIVDDAKKISSYVEADLTITTSDQQVVVVLSEKNGQEVCRWLVDKEQPETRVVLSGVKFLYEIKFTS